MTLKEISLGLFASLVLIGGGYALGNHQPTYSPEDSVVETFARVPGMAVGITHGKYNCRGLRAVGITAVEAKIGCASLKKDDILIRWEDGTLMEIPVEMFHNYKK